MNQTIISREEARKIAGQSIMIRMPGTRLEAEVADYLREHHIRAICLFRQNMVDQEQLSQFTADLRAVMGPEALIGIDQEGGAVVRSTWVPQPPAAMSLGASDDLDLAREVGAAVARSVKSLGFNWNFAPVLDLNNNVNNPVISERSFGAEPAKAVRLASAWMEGSLSEGVACCVKHFPGHGDTHVDSHRDLPEVNKSRAQLDALELAPFQAAAKHAPAMMTAHIVYPQLDAENPATMSPKILTGILRDEWNYHGVVITDGMDMHAIAGRYGVGNAAVRALAAGADMVMALGTRETQLETLEALTDAIEQGQIPYELLQKKLKRIRKLANDYPCAPKAYTEEQDVADRALMARAWKAGLTPYCNPSKPAAGSRVRLVISADVVSDGVSEAGISADKVAAMLRRVFDVEVTTFSDANTFDWNAVPQDGRFVILASTVRIRYNQHARETWKPDLHLVLWNPFQCLDIAAPALITYGFAPPAIEAVEAWLRDEVQATGQIPVPQFERQN
ncbi:beta-N-acetylhexosaminidase [Undibacterium cyanobacteriorum]|uniref:Beta-N-acetylhexosaminidase n=1 Tax=Undibacterium cyanobacteriorum TaxID=3073561 RepID=A0ABY9RE21_9BURK|nr:beta-N-acetylhexosaminidase [Undibacterium sp. 20NA77.5]WMW79478.1 beta-N-acetylhexosaminidase [Undibacterium sp. 20NA77.5]